MYIVYASAYLINKPSFMFGLDLLLWDDWLNFAAPLCN